MAVIDWPDTSAMRPESVEWSPSVVPELVGTSAFNQSTQATVMGAGYWVVTVTIGARRRTEVPAWEAFIAQMSETRNRIRFWDWRWEAPRGVATGTPVVSGANQTGRALVTSGWTSSTAGLLLPGDYVGLTDASGKQLRRVIAQADSNGGGVATLQLDQPVRLSPTNGSAVVLTKPTALFVCTTDKAARGFRQDGARHRGPTLSFTEVFQ